MDNISSTNSNTSSNKNHAASATSFAAKLRRLKIEESILLQSLNKSVSTGSQLENEIGVINDFSSEFKKFFSQTKNTYKELSQLFEDIKASTSSKEVIKCIDIDEIKKNTHELENKIRSFKTYLHTEITSLKSDERLLNQKLNDPILINYLKRKPRVQTAKYTEIVPSPVKTLMSSPFKCIEVQEFQEFMKNSRNRYGGWNEYHHNIFVNIWQKYFDTDNPTTNLPEDSQNINLFLREVIPKLLDLNEEDVLSHVKWYLKYVNLKDRQQKAIDKWRSNRSMMKPTGKAESAKDCENVKTKSVKKKTNQPLAKGSASRFTRTCLSDDMSYKPCMNKEEMECDEQSGLNFLKSTKQWNTRRNSEEIKNETTINNVENIKKLGTPIWRIGL